MILERNASRANTGNLPRNDDIRNGPPHARPHWEGVSPARIGPGSQAAGPNGNVGFQSDAGLGFDHRWGNLPSHYADTTR